jgi:hypothetical protein
MSRYILYVHMEISEIEIPKDMLPHVPRAKSLRYMLYHGTQSQ